MASELKNLSEYDHEKVPVAKSMRFGILVSEWNDEVTFALRDGAVSALLKHGADKKDIEIEYVPGTFELTAGARLLAKTQKYDAIIVLGCVIQGETRHFDYICQGIAQGITHLNVKFDMPFIFGILTTANLQQAKERAGGRLGNKGDEAAITAIKMVDLHRRIK